MDVLSNVLRITNLATHVLGALEFAPPWAIAIEARDRAAVYVVKQGSCWLRGADGQVMRLDAGDVVLLAVGDEHWLASDPGARDFESYRSAIARAQNGVVASRHAVPDVHVPSTVLQCAGYEFSQEMAHPLLSLLPKVIRLTVDQVNETSELQSLLHLIDREVARRDAGNEVVAPRLIDALFVYILRAWLREQPQGAGGWLGALRDPQIRKALSKIHEAPQAPWTVESLARSVAMSRAAFAKRFNDLVGEPPLAYVTRWRMDLAAKLLRESRESVARIAGRVGYISETAFAKAFRRRRNIAPGQYRYRKEKVVEVVTT